MVIWEIGQKYKKVVLLTDNTKTTHYPRRTTNRQTILDVKVFIQVVSRTNKIIRDHQENYLNINRMTSTCSNVVRNKKRCAINRLYPENITYGWTKWWTGSFEISWVKSKSAETSCNTYSGKAAMWLCCNLCRD